MRKAVDLSGMIFGRWSVLCKAASGKGRRSRWLCRCDCGVERTVSACHLVSGASTGCGSHANKERRQSGHPLSSTYYNIIQRCENPNNRAFVNYGGRGIAMCQEWREDFWRFVADMGAKPTSNHTIERRDNGAGYSPSNCYWADRKSQNRNTRRNRIVTFDGRRMALSEACELSGVKYHTAKWRLRNGQTEAEAFRL